MKTIYVLIVATLVSISSLYANPSIYGPTGLIEIPTAESIAYKQVNFAVDYAIENNDQDSTEDSSKNNNKVYYKFNLGSFENWELGILGGNFLDEGVFVNMKYFLMSNQEENPLTVAAGLERVGSKDDLAAYLVTSKRFQDGLNAHFGFKAYLQKNLFAAALFGMEYFLDEKMSFLGDLAGERGSRYVLNAGTKIFIDTNVSLRVYVVDITKSREANETLYTFGISYNRYI
jgi:hypothetical protein